jgi:hypothetical protein
MSATRNINNALAAFVVKYPILPELPASIPAGAQVYAKEGTDLKLYVGDELNVPTPVGGGAAAVPVVTEYPTTDASKAGTRFIYKGNEWHYMTQAEIDSTGWTGLVEVGFPAPVSKRYDSFLLYNVDFYVYFNSSSSSIFTLQLLSNQNIVIDFLGLGLVHKFKQFWQNNTGGTVVSFKNAKMLSSLEDVGTSEALRFQSSFMTTEVINDLFTQLPPTNKTATLYVANNPGSATCDPSIATAKGYTVITS